MISVSTPITSKTNVAGDFSCEISLISVETKKLEKYDVSKLFIPYPKDEQLVGDGSGEITVLVYVVGAY